ncbi:MAG: chorismate mutase, partial [Lachnospiraceae bacterium]|nr:chorismate mutase [Lachnospiraceae bacterium]
MKDLKEIRKDIDRVDNEIIALYKERMGYTTEVAEYKIANNKAVFDKQREDEKLAHLSTFA